MCIWFFIVGFKLEEGIKFRKLLVIRFWVFGVIVIGFIIGFYGLVVGDRGLIFFTFDL